MTDQTNPDHSASNTDDRNQYWQANIRILATLLSVWAFIAFGCSIFLMDWLDQFSIGGFPLGFWFSQQGAMLIFVVIIFVYHFWMERVEREHNVSDDLENESR